MRPSPRRLQEATLLNGRGRAHHAFAANPPLSIKCMLNCRARYRVGGRDLLVDDAGYLVLSEHQPYEITIDRSEPRGMAESFIVWFPTGWAEEVARVETSSCVALLDQPRRRETGVTQFAERYTRHDRVVSPHLQKLYRAQRRAPLDDTWLEERLRWLLAALVQREAGHACEAAQLTALRPGTRAELWRRLNRARDMIHAHSSEPITLSRVASACALSPFHLLRMFKAAFGLTPHAWLAQCRLNHAQQLLAHTTEPVTEICAQVGFESLGSFSTWFARATGTSPRVWRRTQGRRGAIRNFREVPAGEVVLPCTASR